MSVFDCDYKFYLRQKSTRGITKITRDSFGTMGFKVGNSENKNCRDLCTSESGVAEFDRSLTRGIGVRIKEQPLDRADSLAQRSERFVNIAKGFFGTQPLRALVLDGTNSNTLKTLAPFYKVDTINCDVEKALVLHLRKKPSYENVVYGSLGFSPSIAPKAAKVFQVADIEKALHRKYDLLFLDFCATPHDGLIIPTDRKCLLLTTFSKRNWNHSHNSTNPKDWTPPSEYTKIIDISETSSTSPMVINIWYCPGPGKSSVTERPSIGSLVKIEWDVGEFVSAEVVALVSKKYLRVKFPETPATEVIHVKKVLEVIQEPSSKTYSVPKNCKRKRDDLEATGPAKKKKSLSDACTVRNVFSSFITRVKEVVGVLRTPYTHKFVKGQTVTKRFPGCSGRPYVGRIVKMDRSGLKVEWQDGTVTSESGRGFL